MFATRAGKSASSSIFISTKRTSASSAASRAPFEKVIACCSFPPSRVVHRHCQGPDSKKTAKLAHISTHYGGTVAKTTLDPKFLPLLEGRRIASLGTLNEDGSPHLTAVWYLYQDGCFFVATSSRSRKARNLAARPKATLMVEARKPGSERGVTATGPVEIISGERSHELNARIYRRYLS